MRRGYLGKYRIYTPSKQRPNVYVILRSYATKNPYPNCRVAAFVPLLIWILHRLAVQDDISLPSIFTREATRCQGTVAKVAIKASGATCAWTLRSDGAWHPVFVPITGRVRNVGITRGAFPGWKILSRALLKGALNPRRARGQITIFATGFARGVILNAI